MVAWWLAAGGTEGDLMRLAGWKSRSMSIGPPTPLPSNEPAPPTPGWASATVSKAGQVSAPPRRLQHARRGYWPVR